MSSQPIPSGSDARCWIEIGVWGDGTCVELPRVSHCRNCEVYAASGRRLLDRRAPEEYIESWTELLAQEQVAVEAATSPYLAFRVGQAWLALPATSLREVTEPSVIRKVPHRSRDILQGLVNVRGELYPCVSLHTLFGEKSAMPLPRTARFLVVRRTGQDWVFPVDQVDAIHDITQQQTEPLPATLTNVDVNYTQGLFHWGDKTAAIIDENLLFATLAREIA